MDQHFDYDFSLDPPAPVLAVGIGSAAASRAPIVVRALVDSGADVTMFPTALLKSAGARYVEQRYLRGVFGKAVLVHRYLTTIHIGTHAIHGVRVIGVESTSGESLIGRDVLNQLHVTLDGLAETCMIRT